MKFFFTANNFTQLDALEEMGVKNILTSFKYMKGALDVVCHKFENVILIAGNIDNVDKYYTFHLLYHHR